MIAPRSPLSLRKVTEGLLLLGTAIAVYWRPLSARISLKPSDIVLALALCTWVLCLLQLRRAPRLHAANLKVILPPLALLASLLAATVFGHWRYDLNMSRNGIILLVRLAGCIGLFLAIYHLSRIDATFAKRVTFALLSSIIVFPAILVPSLSALMWTQGRFQGLTVNPNTAALGFSITLAVAYTLAIHEAHMIRRLRASGFAIIAVGMLILIMWTQSRAYLVAAFGSVLLGAILTASNLKLPKLRTAVTTALSFLIIVTAGVFLAPRSLASPYVARISWGAFAPSASRTKMPAPLGQAEDSGKQWLAWSNWVLTRGQPSFNRGQYGTLDNLDRLPIGAVRKLAKNPHVQAAILYLELLPTNYWGLGVNYEEKFFLYFPWINGKHHGTNSILDIPVYGGVGAVLSVGYLMLLIARKTRDRLNREPDENSPYAIGAAAAFWGLWIAAVLLGSPIFDYQFWLLTAIALI